MYEYRAQLVNVVDADTIDVDIDLGLEVHTLTRIRLAGVNAPEKNTPEGRIAIAFVKAWMNEIAMDRLTLKTVKDHREKYGRYLAYVHPASDLGLPTSLNDALVEMGHAVLYNGGKR